MRKRWRKILAQPSNRMGETTQKMLQWFKMVVYKFTEKMRGRSDLWLQGLDFLSSCLGFVLHVLPNSPPFQPGQHPGICLMLVSFKGIPGKMMWEYSQRARYDCREIDTLVLGWWFVVGIAGAGEEVAVSIRLLTKASAHLSSLTRLICKQHYRCPDWYHCVQWKKEGC